MNARFHLVSPFTRTTSVNVWGFNMEVEYDWDEGEPPIWSPIDRAHPGSPPTACLLHCKVNGADITEMLNENQRERIEEEIIEQEQE
jgi:hypothetical protein